MRALIGQYLWKRNGWFIEMVQADVIAISSVQKKRLFSVKNVSLSVIKPVDNVWDTSI